MVIFNESNKKPPTAPFEKPVLNYTAQNTVESYIENELRLPTGTDKLNYEQEKFLSEVNIEKTPIRREISSMTRLKVLNTDPDTKKRAWKEYLVYDEWWYGVDFLGRKVAPAYNTEGVYDEVEIGPDFDEETGSKIVGYKKTGSHKVFTIPFSKAAVDKAIKETQTDDKNFIRYIVKFEGPGVPISNSRSGGWTYDEFTSLTYDEMMKLNFREGGLRSYVTPPPPKADSGIKR